MTEMTPSQSATSAGLSLFIPAALFTVLAVAIPFRTQEPEVTWTIGPLQECTAQALPNVRDGLPPRPNLPIQLRERTVRIEVPSTHDRDWSTLIEWAPQAQGSPCRYELVAFDAAGDRFSPKDRKTYRHLKLDDAERHLWKLEGRPLRTYTLFVRARRPNDELVFASGPVRVVFERRLGVNARLGAFGQFVLLAVLGVAASGLMFYFRPYGARSRWSAKLSREVVVAIVAATGGFVTGLLIDLVPPDFGGYDEPAKIQIALLGGLAVAVLTAVLGPLFDWYRRVLASRPLRRRVMQFVPLIVLAFILVAVVKALRSEAHSGKPFEIMNFKTLYYGFLGIAAALPILLYEDPLWQRHLERGAGGLLPVRDRALRLILLSLVGMLLMTTLAVALGAVRQPYIVGQVGTGFYKPLGGYALDLLIVPVVVGLSLAMSLGEERPLWVQDLDISLVHYQRGSDARRRAQFARQALGLLARHRRELHRQAPHLAFTARVALPLIRGMRGPDIEQLAAEAALPPEGAKQILQEVEGALQRVPVAERRIDTPLLLVRDGRELALGRIVLSALHAPTPVLPSLRITYDGRPIQTTSHLGEGVSTLSWFVEAWVGRRNAFAAPFYNSWITVDFQTPDEGASDLSGRSHELPVLLSALGLALDRPPLFPGWMATGAVDLFLRRIEPAERLEIKSRALGQPNGGNLLIASAEVMTPAAPASGFELVCLEQLSVSEAQAQVERIHAAGGCALVSVSTLGQAVAFLYGVDVEL